MALTHTVYGLSLATMTNGEWSFTGGAAKALLVTSTYVFNQATHKYRSDLTGELAAGGGYTTGGVALGTKTSVYTSGTKTLALSCANIVFAALTATGITGCVLYFDTGTSTTSALLSYIDFGGAQSATSQNLQLTINAAGLVTYQVA